MFTEAYRAVMLSDVYPLLVVISGVLSFIAAAAGVLKFQDYRLRRHLIDVEDSQIGNPKGKGRPLFSEVEEPKKIEPPPPVKQIEPPKPAKKAQLALPTSVWAEGAETLPRTVDTEPPADYLQFYEPLYQHDRDIPIIWLKNLDGVAYDQYRKRERELVAEKARQEQQEREWKEVTGPASPVFVYQPEAQDIMRRVRRDNGQTEESINGGPWHPVIDVEVHYGSTAGPQIQSLSTHSGRVQVLRYSDGRKIEQRM